MPPPDDDHLDAQSRARPIADDPFARLGLPPRYDIQPAEIRRAYLIRAAAAHPDANPDAYSDPASPEADPAALNRARAVLENPERRAEALLTLLGGPSARDCPDLPDGFLLEVMERREAVEDALASQDPEARAACERDAALDRARYVAQASKLFAAAQCSASTPEHLREIRVLLNAWRYTERLIEQLDPDYDPGRADFAS